MNGVDPAAVQLSFIVVNWNKPELTRQCLDSIVAHTRDIPFEIIVVDNGSAPEHLPSLRALGAREGVRLIELNANLFFGEANNIGVEAAHGDRIVLINNDIELTAGYLGPLVRLLDEAHAAGAVGPKFVYPDGRLQEAGGYVDPDGWTIQHGKAGVAVERISARGAHIVDYCSAACLLLRRELFLAAGGFDPLFDPAYYEDVDLMLRIRALGYYTYLCADVTVIHDENSTSRSLWDEERLTALIARNHARFVDRWGSYVARRLFDDVAIPAIEPVRWTAEAPPRRDRPRVALHGPGLVADTPEWRAILRLAGEISREDHVIVVADEACSRCRILTLAQRAGAALDAFSVERAGAGVRRPGDTELRLGGTPDGGLAVFAASGPRAAEIGGRFRPGPGTGKAL
ncbi:glycosyltransferase family 2 protein [Chelatococcus reniformis]|uniref:Glycosyltransferase 2-like domain-containing protein n=1 Tax=Chelatococcus reniformis TaxID=1494448 RepID=A0A916U1M2_9HYPH|nr:glycosyltransferase family 2 protein [Chelatococcus reniformis]GGC56597.1 hypothetical protein GCM10010994_14410 [Chelatococcus reniformis]